MEMSSGLAFSPAEDALYFADSYARVIYVYNYRPGDGSLRNRRVLARVPIEDGLPDGLTVDAEGFIWSANWFGRSIIRYDPDGRIESRIPSPPLQPHLFRSVALI
jgi:sugar lactone lactonase YvrE